MTEVLQTPLLDKVKKPSDLRNLTSKDLEQLADELRNDTVRNVSFTGGHLGASLGVVELTVALHYTFNTPNDRLIWDVGHQCYPHKILTGRREQMRTIRQGGGFRGSPRGQKAPMILSVRRILLLQSPQGWGWLWQEN